MAYQSPHDKKEFITSLFKSITLFEKEVLEVESDFDRYDVMKFMGRQLVTQVMKEQLNFSYLKSYNDISTKNIKANMVKIFIDEFLEYLQEEHRYTLTMAQEVVLNRQCIHFLQAIVSKYYDRFSHLIYEQSVETFFEKVAALTEPSKANSLINECIEGHNGHASLMVYKSGERAAYSTEQVWTRVRDAYLTRKKAVKKLQIELSETLEQMESTQNEYTLEEQTALQDRYLRKQGEIKSLQQRSLDQYDASVKRMKEAMIESLQGFSS